MRRPALAWALGQTIPAGRHRGRSVGDVFTRYELGREWVGWAARHPDVVGQPVAAAANVIAGATGATAIVDLEAELLLHATAAGAAAAAAEESTS